MRNLGVENNVTEVVSIFPYTYFQSLSKVGFHSSISGWILSIVCRIEVFSSSSVRGLLSYTRDLRKHQRKKSHVDKSGERGGHGISPNREMTWLLNKARTRSIEARAVWAVAPSLWNQTVRVFIPRTCNSGMKKFLVISVYRCELTVNVTQFSSKKYGPITHSLVTTNHTVTLGLCKVLHEGFPRPNNDNSVYWQCRLGGNMLHRSS